MKDGNSKEIAKLERDPLLPTRDSSEDEEDLPSGHIRV